GRRRRDFRPGQLEDVAQHDAARSNADGDARASNACARRDGPCQRAVYPPQVLVRRLDLDVAGMAVAPRPQPSPRFTRPASSGDVDDHGLGLQVLIDPFLAALAAQTRLLEAAERDLVKPRDQTPSVSGWPHDAAPGCRGRRDL